MKTERHFVRGALALALLTLNSQHSTVFAQGSLTPPGAPAPTMLTLSQIEPRTPIASAPYTITQPGSYYLTTNLTVSGGSAITIAANGVTLDLNGFTLSSTAASAIGFGIQINSGGRNITIANGFIQGGVTNNGSGVYSGSGFAEGIYYSGSAPVNVLVSRVSVSGCLDKGIYLNHGDSTVVESCTVRTVGGYGIAASTVKQASAIDCGAFGIYGDQVSDCRGQSSGNSDGVYATTALNCYGYSGGNGSGVNAITAQNCYGSSASGDGVYASTAENCYGSSGGNGIGVYADSSAQNCSGSSSGSGSGVQAPTALNCHGSSASGYGVYSGSIANGCYGYSSSGTGLSASIANGCYGYSSSGTGLSVFIANVCHGDTGTGTALSATHNVNSF